MGTGSPGEIKHLTGLNGFAEDYRRSAAGGHLRKGHYTAARYAANMLPLRHQRELVADFRYRYDRSRGATRVTPRMERRMSGKATSCVTLIPSPAIHGTVQWARSCNCCQGFASRGGAEHRQHYLHVRLKEFGAGYFIGNETFIFPGTFFVAPTQHEVSFRGGERCYSAFEDEAGSGSPGRKRSRNTLVVGERT